MPWPRSNCQGGITQVQVVFQGTRSSVSPLHQNRLRGKPRTEQILFYSHSFSGWFLPNQDKQSGESNVDPLLPTHGILPAGVTSTGTHTQGVPLPVLLSRVESKDDAPSGTLGSSCGLCCLQGNPSLRESQDSLGFDGTLKPTLLPREGFSLGAARHSPQNRLFPCSPWFCRFLDSSCKDRNPPLPQCRAQKEQEKQVLSDPTELPISRRGFEMGKRGKEGLKRDGFPAPESRNSKKKKKKTKQKTPPSLILSQTRSAGTAHK